MSEESARYFAQGEIKAIQTGSHWTHGKQTPNDPELAIVHILVNGLTEAGRELYDELAGKLMSDGMDRAAAEKKAMAELLHRYPIAECKATDQSETIPEKPQPTEPLKHEGAAGLAEYTRRGIRLLPCVPVEEDPKRYRPIVGKGKWGDVATSDIDRITEYQAGALWPNELIHHFRFIPKSAKVACLDVDQGHSNGADGEANLDRLLRARGFDPKPPLLRDLCSFPVRVETPSGGLHLYFAYNGPSIPKAELISGVEVFHVDPLTAGGSRKTNGEYILYGCLDTAPPLLPELLAIITGGEQTRTVPPLSQYRTGNSRSDNDKEELKTRLRQYVKAKGITITKKGSQEWINCPLHDDSEPSMMINTTGRYAGICKCYGCGASLNVFGLARALAGIPEGKKYFPKVAEEIKNTLGTG
jgi:hypothetical protein